MGLVLTAYKLQPWRGTPSLRPSQVATRLLAHFDNVTVDFIIGRQFLQWLIQNPRRLDVFEEMRARGLGIDIADDFYADHWVHVKVFPDLPLYVSVNSEAHDDAIRPLVFQIADALDYAVEAVWEESNSTEGSVR